MQTTFEVSFGVQIFSASRAKELRKTLGGTS